jgi:hypothetical protein
MNKGSLLIPNYTVLCVEKKLVKFEGSHNHYTIAFECEVGTDKVEIIYKTDNDNIAKYYQVGEYYDFSLRKRGEVNE